MARSRRSPIRHTVHTRDPRYNVPQYGRGKGVVSVPLENQIGRPDPKIINGEEVFPIRVTAKGKDWVDYARSDGMEIRCWDFDERYPLLKKAPLGFWLWIPKKSTRKNKTISTKARANSILITQKQVGNGTWIDGEYKGLRFQSQIFETGSRYGINKGPVSRLFIDDEKGKRIYDFERSLGKPSRDPRVTEIKKFLSTHNKTFIQKRVGQRVEVTS